MIKGIKRWDYERFFKGDRVTFEIASDFYSFLLISPRSLSYLFSMLRERIPPRI
jgi:hypothetical protein